MTNTQLCQMVDRLLDTLAEYDDPTPVLDPFDKTMGIIMSVVCGREIVADGEKITGYISVYVGRS